MSETTAIRMAARTANLGFSDIVKIRNRVLELKQNGTPVLQLEGGEPFPPTPEFVKDAMKRALDENQTRYAPSSGIPPLLAVIQDKLRNRNGIEASPSNLIVTSGAAHGLFCAFQATLDPGDEAIFFSPFWTPIRDHVRFCGATSVLVPWAEVREGDAAEAISRRVTDRTRVIYINSPSNPSGDILDRPGMESIARLAIDRDLIVIADEAYEDLVYGSEHVSIASLPGMFERTITAFTLSKSYSMTGWRCGYVAAGDAFMDSIRRLVLNSTNGVSTPTQHAALAAIRDGDAYLNDTRQEYLRRRDLLLEGIRAAGFECRTPGGAFYLFPDVRKRLGDDSWKAMNELLDRTSVATVPGVVFGPEGEGHLRMSYSNSVENLSAAIEAMKKL